MCIIFSFTNHLSTSNVNDPKPYAFDSWTEKYYDWISVEAIWRIYGKAVKLFLLLSIAHGTGVPSHYIASVWHHKCIMVKCSLWYVRAYSRRIVYQFFFLPGAHLSAHDENESDAVQRRGMAKGQDVTFPLAFIKHIQHSLTYFSALLNHWCIFPYATVGRNWGLPLELSSHCSLSLSIINSSIVK